MSDREAAGGQPEHHVTSYFLWCEDVCHPCFVCLAEQCAPGVEVTHLPLTPEGARSKILHTPTSCTRLASTPEPMRTEPEAIVASGDPSLRSRETPHDTV